MKIMLVAIGTSGDVLPFIGLGRALLGRGHQVHLLSGSKYRKVAEASGFGFHEVKGLLEVYDDPHFYHPVHSMRVVSEGYLLPAVKPIYRAVSQLDHREWTILASSFSYGARLAQEVRGFRLTTCVVCPYTFQSDYYTPVTPGVAPPAWAPFFIRRGFNRFVSRLWDKKLAPELNAFRREIGLTPVEDIFYSWCLSPDRVIGLFPAWFAPKERDWPRQFVHGDFSVSDIAPDKDLPLELTQPGSPMVIFCAGSAGPVAKPFFEAAVSASRNQSWRAVLLTGENYRPPGDLPGNIFHYDYVPLSRLLPLSSLIVHHGGLGTISLATASGTPQVVVPLGHDQFDNAARVERLGVARQVAAGLKTPQRLSAAIRQALKDPEIAVRSRDLAVKIPRNSGLNDVVSLIEGEN